LCRRAIDQTGEICRQQLLTTAWRSCDQIGVRKPVLFVGAAQMFKRGGAGEGHSRLRIAGCGFLVNSGKREPRIFQISLSISSAVREPSINTTRLGSRLASAR